jgi:hypothetical protein
LEEVPGGGAAAFQRGANQFQLGFAIESSQHRDQPARHLSNTLAGAFGVTSGHDN